MPGLALRFLTWLGGSLLFLAAGLWVLGTRADLPSVLRNPGVLVQLGAFLALAVVSAFSALNLSVPGLSRQWLNALPILLLAGTAALPVSELIAHGSPAGPGIRCVRNLILLSLVPGAVLFRMLRTAAPLRPAFAVLSATLAVTALSTLATRLICANDAPLHLLLWHLLPLVAISTACTLGARTLLRSGRPLAGQK